MSNVAVPTVPQTRTSNGAAAQSAGQGSKTGHPRINKVAVLGAGTMGARIAAHFANAGVPCVLLDIVLPDAAQSTDPAKSNDPAKNNDPAKSNDKSVRRKIVTAGLEGAVKSKPAAFFEKGLER